MASVLHVHRWLRGGGVDPRELLGENSDLHK